MGHKFLINNWMELTHGSPNIKNDFHEELTTLYSSSKRYYHNLKHIEALLKLSDEYKHLLSSPRTIGFTIWYHDAVYDTAKNNNEEKSAELAKKHLTELGLDNKLVNNCCDLIIATKTHQLIENSNSFDAKFFLDIDLSTLAADRTDYIEYTEQIRKEYSMYPDSLYRKGRKKVLKHFLGMDKIYKTELFSELWEQKAKENLDYELSIF